jgi:hypothetical protein
MRDYVYKWEPPYSIATVRNGKQYNPYLVDTQPGDSAEQEHIRQVRYLTMVRLQHARRYGTARNVALAYLMRSGAIQTNVGEEVASPDVGERR